jgi:hypothetical protein
LDSLLKEELLKILNQKIAKYNKKKRQDLNDDLFDIYMQLQT